MDGAVAKGVTDPQQMSAYSVSGSMINMSMVYLPIIRAQANVSVFSRKVVRDSIRGISESRLDPSTMLIADDLHYP